MENFDHILLFRTNFKTRADKKVLCSLLENEGIDQWNLDADDIDRVLRIVSATLKHQHIIKLITNHGYECSELT